MMGAPGFCILCDKPLTENGRLNGEYTEVEVEWSNKSRMKIAICKDDAMSHAWATAEGKKKITDWHWTYWLAHGAVVDKEIVIV